MKTLSIINLCILQLALANYIDAQSLNSNLGKVEKDSIIYNIAGYFQDQYVFPDKGLLIKNELLEQQTAGKFDSILTYSDFRKALQRTIRNVVDDKHIRLYSARDPAPKEIEESYLKSEYGRRKAMNFGIPEIKVLENNIGYLRITKFTSQALMGPVIRASTEFLKNVDGLVIDLSSRGGGNSDAVVLLLSYFLPPETPIFYWLDRQGKEVERNWTHPYVGGYRFDSIPVVLICSDKTFSGSEAFCYIMKHHKRATIIGQTTRGGAHTYKEMFPSEKFVVLVPHERVLSAKTNNNWEGTGVIPDIVSTTEESYLKAIEFLKQAIQKN